MNKLAVFIWWALYEVYHGKTSSGGPKGTIPGTIRQPSKTELDKYFQAGGAAGYDPKVHWCGVFQTYLLKCAGVNCHWDGKIVDDSGGRDLQIVEGKEARKGLALGDIVRINHDEHHFMVLEPAARGFLKSVEGNAGGLEHPLVAAFWMGNAKHNVVEDIYLRYRVIGTT